MHFVRNLDLFTMTTFEATSAALRVGLIVALP